MMKSHPVQWIRFPEVLRQDCHFYFFSVYDRVFDGVDFSLSSVVISCDFDSVLDWLSQALLSVLTCLLESVDVFAFEMLSTMTEFTPSRQ
jgi:hypothetical protein